MPNTFFEPPLATLRSRDAATGQKILIEIGNLFADGMAAIYIGQNKAPTYMIDSSGLERIRSHWDQFAGAYPSGSASSLIEDIGLRYQFASTGDCQVIEVSAWDRSPNRPTLVIERHLWDAITEAVLDACELADAPPSRRTRHRT